MIEINDLTFGYKKHKKLFDHLNLKLGAGNIVGLLGKNGAGKTTLLKQINGMLYPDEGECRVFGYSSKNRMPQMLQDIFIIPEEFYLPPVSIKKYAEINSSFYPGFSFTDYDNYINEFGLDLNEKTGNLSQGQKKKVLIAFGLAVNTRLLIMDEPTNGLDIPSKSQFRKLMAAVLTDEKTFIISSHQVRDLENLLDKIVIVENGSIIFNQDVFEISKHLTFKSIYSVYDKSITLYCEENLGAYSAILKSKEEEETLIDLELLFNGVISEPENINNVFKRN